MIYDNMMMNGLRMMVSMMMMMLMMIMVMLMMIMVMMMMIMVMMIMNNDSGDDDNTTLRKVRFITHDV